MSEVEPQAHIFVVWQSGFEHLSKIFWELSQEFEIKFAQVIEWNYDEIPEALTRMYPNRNFTHESSKVKEIGGNQLVYILVVDTHPEIKKDVNQRTLRQKQRHRTQPRSHSIFRWRVKNVNYLHASDLETDAFLNYQALTGGSRVTFEELKNKKSCIYIPKQTQSSIELIELLIPSFERIQDVFNVLDEHTNYTVLRNWEEWPETLISSEHGDIDILTKNYYTTLLLLGARPVFPQDYRVHHLVKVGEKSIPFDVRFVGDGYYDQNWQNALLDQKTRQDGFNRLADADYFWTLLYHGVFHKRGLSEKYRSKLESMQIGTPSRSLLIEYLKKNRFGIPTPNDKSVRFHSSLISQILFWGRALLRATSSLAISSRENLSYLSSHESLSAKKIELSRAKKIKYGVYALDDIIIKTTDPQRTFLLKNEESMLRAVGGEAFFPDIIDSFEHGGQYYLVLKKKPGKNLADVFSLSQTQVKSLPIFTKKILSALKRHHVLHRDIRPNNLLITKEGSVSLVDFQFAIKHDGSIQTHSDLERYILFGAEQNLGGRWYSKKAVDQDIAAIELIVQESQTRKSLYKFLRKSLRRFTF